MSATSDSLSPFRPKVEVLTAALAFLVGCGSDAPRHMDALRGHEADIARFERWALRATEHAAHGDEARLEEALFANVRAEHPFALVQVTREGRDGFTLTYPHEGVVPQDLAWRSGRSEVLGEVEVAGHGASDHAQLWVRVQPMESAGTPLVITLSIEASEATTEPATSAPAR